MGEVIARLAMSLDGFIADPDDGCDELFGRRLYDITNGWNGHPGGEVIEDRGVTHLRYHVRKES